MRLATSAAVAAAGLMPLQTASPPQSVVAPIPAPVTPATVMPVDPPDVTRLDELESLLRVPLTGGVKSEELEILSYRPWAMVPLAPPRDQSASDVFVIRGCLCDANGVIESRILRVSPVIVRVPAHLPDSRVCSTPNP